MSDNQVFSMVVFRPVGKLQKDFKLNFVPAVREEKLVSGRTGIVLDVGIGDGAQKPFVLYRKKEIFCFFSKDDTFCFKKLQSEIPSYEVFLDSHWAWVNRIGNQGLDLLFKEYAKAVNKN